MEFSPYLVLADTSSHGSVQALCPWYVSFSSHALLACWAITWNNGYSTKNTSLELLRILCSPSFTFSLPSKPFRFFVCFQILWYFSVCLRYDSCADPMIDHQIISYTRLSINITGVFERLVIIQGHRPLIQEHGFCLWLSLLIR